MKNELQFLHERLHYFHQSKKYDRGLNDHLSSMLEKLLLLRSDDPEGTQAANEVIDLIKNHRLKLQYHDWCNILQLHMCRGSFYEIKVGFVAVKLTSFVHKHVKNHKRDLQFIMAAVFMGFENMLEPVYPYYYYSIAENRGAKNTYFRENSLFFEGVAIPYHAVYAALVKELPHSIYTQTGRNIKRKLKEGMLGFPEVWSQYTWNDFQNGYKELHDNFMKLNGRPVEPADLLVAGLTHTNKYHGLRLFDRNECTKLNNWIENLTGEHRSAIEEFENSRWEKISE